MKRRSYTSYRDSDMARAKPRKHVFRTILNSKLKQPRNRFNTDTGLVEDRTNSTTVVRVIVGLLLIHLIVIGGLILRGKIKSADAGSIAAPTITAPPTPVEAEPAPVLPQPKEGPVANPVRNDVPHITMAPTEPTQTAQPAVNEPEIITPPTIAATDDIAEPADEPAVTPVPAAPATPAEPTYAKHLVSSGETLYGIAAKNNVTVEAIRQANPQIRNNNIISGTYLNIPVKADSAAGRAIAAQQAAEAASEAAKTYTVKRGDTLGRIARKNKTTVAKLMQINNIPKGKEGSIRVGDTIRISE